MREVAAVVEPQALAYLYGDPSEPGHAFTAVELTEEGGRATVTVTLNFASAEDLRRMVERGARQGLEGALDRLAAHVAGRSRHRHPREVSGKPVIIRTKGDREERRRQVSARDAGGVLASKAGCGPEALARYFRVLGDPTRLRIIEALLERERTVSELVSLVGAPQSRVSNHLACLKWCRFADAERRGRRVVYRIADPEVEQLMRVARSLASAHSEHLTTCRRIGPDWI